LSEIVLTVCGIAVPSLLLSLAIRRWIEPLRWRVIALLLGLTFAFTARGVFTADMPVPLDDVVRGYPYRGLFDNVTSTNPLTNDTVKQILPWMHTVREQFSAGHLPLWNPHLFSGYPLLGNAQSAALSLLRIVTLPLNLGHSMTAEGALKVLIALTFTFL
jgi:hypothetical protein